MCFHASSFKTAEELEKRFKASFKKRSEYTPKKEVNGFSFPTLPVITNDAATEIQLATWGLIPSWSKDKEIQKSTLNAKIESLHEKASFKHHTKQRCLVLVDGFYEWQWLDTAGKRKLKHEVGLPDNGAFAIAGIFNDWIAPETGEVLKTFSMITCDANAFMRVIHNSKMRMPLMLTEANQTKWLTGDEIIKNEVSLSAKPCDSPSSMQTSLF